MSKEDEFLSIGVMAKRLGLTRHNLKSSKCYQPFLSKIDGITVVNTRHYDELKALTEENRAKYMIWQVNKS